MIKHNRWVALGTLGAMSLTAFGGALTTEAHADSKTAKKVAIGSALVTGYGLIRGKKKVAIIGGVATGASYYAYKRSKKKEESRRQAYYRSRYGRNWRNHYKPGT